MGWGFKATNPELSRLADHSPSFSQGDLAGLRRIYGQQKRELVHFGEWHRACSAKCTETACCCGACGVLPGGINCGYTGNSGHWSCCMKEQKDSFCSTVHSGFWHMACVGDACSDKVCRCKSCGGGCTYEGTKGHWSCCNQERFDSKTCSMIKQNKFLKVRVHREVSGGKSV